MPPSPRPTLQSGSSLPPRTNLDLLASAVSDSDDVAQRAQQAQPGISRETSQSAQGPDDARMRSLLSASMAVNHNGAGATDSHGKRKREETLLDDNELEATRRRTADLPRTRPGDVPRSAMTTVTCLHAAVAQKSYGHEKRFLCPPPLVRIQSPIPPMRDQRLTMSVVTEDGTHLAEQGNPMDEQLQFKYLHVGGAANKAKSFHLSLNIATPTAAQSHSWASFESAPVTIISKPSKKTAKTRNVSTCIMDSGSVSLFNRINSQTVRTKYMTVDRAELAASNASWSAFKIQLLDDELGLPIELGSPSRNADLAPAPRPIHYGARVVLTDEATGISSEPLIVRKVDKGKLVKSDGGLVSQMQKIALQRASINSDVPSSPAGLYLSAGRLPLPVHSADRSAISTTHIQATSDGKTLATAHPLTYQAPRSGANGSNADEVDDFLCWTIVGIAEYQYTFFDASNVHPPSSVPTRSISPFPTTISPPVYHPSTNRLELDVLYFFTLDPNTNTPAPLEVWLGNIGPLNARAQLAPASGSAHHLLSQLPQENMPDNFSQQQQQQQPQKPQQQALSVNEDGAYPNNEVSLHTALQHEHEHGHYATLSIEVPALQTMLDAIRRRDADGTTNTGHTSGASPSAAIYAPTFSPGGPSSSSSLQLGLQQKVHELDAGSLSGRTLPLIFVRSHDRTGYLSQYSLACENVFRAGDGGSSGSAGSSDGQHGWILRVVG